MENTNVLIDDNDKNKSARVKLIISRILAYAFLIFNTIVCLFFFYMLFINASKSNDEINAGRWEPLPSIYFFENMNTALFHPTANVNILAGMRNSFLVAALSSVLTCYFSALTAYAIHAYQFKARKFVAVFILAIMMIPAQVASVGFLQKVYELGLTDQLWILIVPSIAAPSCYFYMLQYLKATLPLDLVEASRIDGSSEFMTFNRIVLPIMKPALAVQLIFSFVGSWNNYYMPSLVLVTDESKKTLPVMLATLRSQANSSVDAGQIWMVILLSILPVIIVYVFLSKYIIKGVTSGSVKG